MDMNLGDKIKKLRKDKGLTQKDLAINSNISRSYLADVEGGRYNPSLDVIDSIAKALGISLDELFKDTSDNIYQSIIKRLRDNKLLSQTDLDNALNLPINTIYNIENGITKLSDDVLDKLCKFFNVQSNYILGRTSEEYAGQIDDMEKDMKELIIRLKNASPEKRQKILKILDLFDEDSN